MRDFTLSRYTEYLETIQSSYQNILRFDQFMGMAPKPESYCLIRHDVDRKKKNAFRMAQLEENMGISSNYYFRAKPHTFDQEIIRSIADMGHEVGYHYESLSSQNGNYEKALQDFENNLGRFRKTAVIRTVTIHGSPFSQFNNHKLFNRNNNRTLLYKKYDLIGDVSLDIDYSDILYITDTGRNWHSRRSNIRDRVDSNIHINFQHDHELMNYLRNNPHPKLIFSVHPERWENNMIPWILQYMADQAVNFIKMVLK